METLKLILIKGFGERPRISTRSSLSIDYT